MCTHVLFHGLLPWMVLTIPDLCILVWSETVHTLWERRTVSIIFQMFWKTRNSVSLQSLVKDIYCPSQAKISGGNNWWLKQYCLVSSAIGKTLATHVWFWLNYCHNLIAFSPTRKQSLTLVLSYKIG
jgi:hypothetical protein